MTKSLFFSAASLGLYLAMEVCACVRSVHGCVHKAICLNVVLPFLSCSYRKWFLMNGTKVASSWKNQSCYISKGIPSVFRYLSLTSLHSSGGSNLSLHARYPPKELLIETALLWPANLGGAFLYGLHLRTVRDLTVWVEHTVLNSQVSRKWGKSPCLSGYVALRSSVWIVQYRFKMEI